MAKGLTSVANASGVPFPPGDTSAPGQAESKMRGLSSSGTENRHKGYVVLCADFFGQFSTRNGQRSFARRRFL